MADKPELPDADVLDRFAAGLRDLLADDDLVKAKPQEFTLTIEFAMKLQPYFEGWRVSAEWTSRRDKHKHVSWNDEDGVLQSKPIRPDIIVHHPHSDDNLLVVEAKRSASRQKYDGDIKKLNLMTLKESAHPDCHYGYRLGVHLIVDMPNRKVTGDDVYRNGEVDTELTELLSAMLG